VSYPSSFSPLAVLKTTIPELGILSASRKLFFFSNLHPIFLPCAQNFPPLFCKKRSICTKISGISRYFFFSGSYWSRLGMFVDECWFGRFLVLKSCLFFCPLSSSLSAPGARKLRSVPRKPHPTPPPGFPCLPPQTLPGLLGATGEAHLVACRRR
jgi:hypothetical protein